MSSWLEQIQNLIRAPSFDASDPWCNLAIKEVATKYGQNVSVDLKRVSALKFGQNDNVAQNTFTEIMEQVGSQAIEVILSDNLIDTLSSDDAAFDGDVLLEGHKLVDGVLTAVSQTITVNGTTKVNIPTPLAYATFVQNSDETEFASVAKKVYFYENSAITSGVPDDGAKNHIILHAEHRTSLKSSEAVADDEYVFITEVYGDIDRKQAAVADIFLCERHLGSGKGRVVGGFHTRIIRSVSSTGNNHFQIPLRPYLIIPRNSYIMMGTQSSAASVSISGGFNSIIAQVN